jgi:hypothetical protein
MSLVGSGGIILISKNYITEYTNYIISTILLVYTNYITKTTFTHEIWWADRWADVVPVACGLVVP